VHTINVLRDKSTGLSKGEFNMYFHEYFDRIIRLIIV
jgi:hypothetical protein